MPKSASRGLIKCIWQDEIQDMDQSTIPNANEKTDHDQTVHGYRMAVPPSHSHDSFPFSMQDEYMRIIYCLSRRC